VGDYYTLPRTEELLLRGSAVQQAVERFTVGRLGLGWVRWEGSTDVRGLLGALRELVHFGPGWVEVYPKGGARVKPRRGQGLNRPATIALHGCRPKPGSTLPAFIAHLRSIPNTRFLAYCPTSGTWTFSVEHFTRYGLPGGPSTTLDDGDEDDEDDEDEEPGSFRALKGGDRLTKKGTTDLDTAHYSEEEVVSAQRSHAYPLYASGALPVGMEEDEDDNLYHHSSDEVDISNAEREEEEEGGEDEQEEEEEEEEEEEHTPPRVPSRLSPV
jgi:hypothetical protein